MSAVNTIKTNYSQQLGKVKVMNAVNNGPGGGFRTGTNHDLFAEAKIPYARIHDASFYSAYGGEWTVDVHRIFCNFDADVNDPASYDFAPTDQYLQSIEQAGTEVYYRLGASIEHGKKFGTYPPKDYLKWAQICEHIIMHYTEGWANGYTMKIDYWEIWNEPECVNPQGISPTWQGTFEQFGEFFITVFKHLKGRFPHLKIGGPAISTCWADAFWTTFFPMIKEANVHPDFISYHRYGKTVEDFITSVQKANSWLEMYGYLGTETHLNEWNYVRGWRGQDFIHSVESIKGLKGASFTTGVMCALHKEAVDMLMYYEGRPCSFCGLFDTDLPMKPLKGYYPFLAFSYLRDLGIAVATEGEEFLYSLGATNGKDSALLLTYFDQGDEAEKKDVKVEFRGVPVTDGKLRVEYHILDETHNLECIRNEIFTSGDFDLYLDMPPYTTYLIKIYSK